jgi:hypothetical protein
LKMRLSRLFLLFTFLFLTAALPTAAQTEPTHLQFIAVENDDTPLARDQNFPEVSFDFAPLNDFGMPLANLTPIDFRLNEDNIPISDFQLQPFNESERGVSILVVVDMGAAAGAAFEELKTAVINLYPVLEPADSSGLFLVSLREDGSGVSMGPSVSQIDTNHERGFTNDEGALINLINAQSLDENAGSPLYDAIVKATRFTASQAEHERRAILLISDGIDTNRERTGSGSNFATAETALAEVQQLGVPIFTVGWGSQINAGYLQQLANATGAGYLQAASPDAPAQYLAAIIGQLKQSYRLSYRSQIMSDNNLHDVTVSFANEDNAAPLQFRAYHPQEPQLRAITAVLPGGSAPITLSELTEVQGSVQLQPAIAARGEIRAVNYYLDGSQVATAAALAPPWTFEWDTSSLASGQPHQLLIEIVDTAEPPHVGHYETTVFVAACPLMCQLQQTLGINPAILIGLILVLVIGAVMVFVLRQRQDATVVVNHRPWATPPSGQPRPPLEKPARKVATPSPNAPLKPGPSRLAHNKTEVLRQPFDEIAFLIDLQDGEEYRLLESTTIGSGPNNAIRLVDPDIAPQHAQIHWRLGYFDLTAEDETKINGRDNRQHRLENGDRIEIGRRQLIFKHL